jgi:CheY-like chemotaxis protein
VIVPFIGPSRTCYAQRARASSAIVRFRSVAHRGPWTTASRAADVSKSRPRERGLSRAPRARQSRPVLPRVGPVFEVVVVDDDAPTRELLCTALERSRHTVRGFGAAAEALEAIRASAPRLVVTDLVLGAMSGAELASILRSDRATARIPLVAISGLVDPYVDVVRLFDAYVPKPFDVPVLAHLVDTLIAMSEAASHGPKPLARSVPAASRSRAAR